MSVNSTNLSGNNVTAFNRYRRLAAERAKVEAEAAAKAKAAKKAEVKKQASKNNKVSAKDEGGE